MIISGGKREKPQGRKGGWGGGGGGRTRMVVLRTSREAKREVRQLRAPDGRWCLKPRKRGKW